MRPFELDHPNRVLANRVPAEPALRGNQEGCFSGFFSRSLFEMQLRPGSSPASAPTPSRTVRLSRFPCGVAPSGKSRTFLALVSGASPRGNPRHAALEPWENASRNRLENGSVRHSFQDANYHDQIVKERHKPTSPRASNAMMQRTTPAREPVMDRGSSRGAVPAGPAETAPSTHEPTIHRNGPQPMTTSSMRWPRGQQSRAIWREPIPSKGGSAARLKEISRIQMERQGPGNSLRKPRPYCHVSAAGVPGLGGIALWNLAAEPCRGTLSIRRRSGMLTRAGR